MLARLHARITSHPHREFVANIHSEDGAPVVSCDEFRSYEDARAWVLENGVDVKDIEYVMRHYTDEETAARTLYPSEIGPARELAALVERMAVQREMDEELPPEQWAEALRLARRTNFLLGA